MLVEGDLGVWFRSFVAVLLVVIVPVMGLLGRWKWRRAVARSEEIERLAKLAAQEAEEAAMADYGYGYVEGYGYGSPVIIEDHMSEMGPTDTAAMEEPPPPVIYLLHPCAVCSTLTKARCKQCKAVHYCSGKCQIIHWRQGHKNQCFSHNTNDLELTSNSNLSKKEEKEDASYNNYSEIEGYQTAKSDFSSSTEPKSINSDLSSTHNEKNEEESKHFIDEEEKISSNNPESSINLKIPEPNSENHTVESVKSVKTNGEKGAAMCLQELQKNDKNNIKPLTRQNSEIITKYKGIFPYDMFVKLYHWNKFDFRPYGLVNCGNSCYVNVVLQCLIFTPPLNAYFLQGSHSKSCESNGWCFICEIESLLKKAKEGVSPISPIRIISHLQKIGSHFNNGSEEDAHEFLRLAIDMMQNICLKEAGIKESGSLEEGTTLIGLTFGGYLRSKIECMNCGGKSVRNEKMMDLTVEIDGEIGTLEEALKQFTRAEILDGDNKYQCGRCKSYSNAIKKLKVLEAPNILSIVLKRFQSGRFGKLNKTIKFPEILNLAPYIRGTSDKSPIYHLYGVIVHLDTMNASFSGHYVCYIKNLQNKWFKIDDSTVEPVDLVKVLSKGAYMLLYARCSPRAPRIIRSSLIPRDPQKNRGGGRYWEDDDSSISDNSSYFSETTTSNSSSGRDSNSIDDQVIDRILGEMGICCNNNNNSTSSDSDTSSSSSPSPVFFRHGGGGAMPCSGGGGGAMPCLGGRGIESVKPFRNVMGRDSIYSLGRIYPFQQVRDRRSRGDDF